MHEPFPKDLATGSYDLVALDTLSRGPVYVYGLVRTIFERSNHTIRWHEGTAYRVLHDLERRGLATSVWQGPKDGRQRRYYRLTPRGRRAVQQLRRQWHDFTLAINALLRSR